MASEVSCRAGLILFEYQIGNNISQSKTAVPLSNITLGVPRKAQCFVCVLFLLYINDTDRFSNQIRFVHFADDTTFFAFDTVINNVHACE